MEHHHLVRHSKQQATQGLAFVGVACMLFGTYIAFAFAAPYYEKSVLILSQLPLKQQSLSLSAKQLSTSSSSRAIKARAVLPPTVVNDTTTDDAKLRLELQQYSLDGQTSILIFAFAMYKIAIIISCTFIFFGGLLLWTAYHGWWSFLVKSAVGSTDRSAIKPPVAVVRRRTPSRR